MFYLSKRKYLRWILCAINSYRILKYLTKIFTFSILFFKKCKKTCHVNVPALTQMQKFCIMQFAREQLSIVQLARQQYTIAQYT